MTKYVTLSHLLRIKSVAMAGLCMSVDVYHGYESCCKRSMPGTVVPVGWWETVNTREAWRIAAHLTNTLVGYL